MTSSSSQMPLFPFPADKFSMRPTKERKDFVFLKKGNSRRNRRETAHQAMVSYAGTLSPEPSTKQWLGPGSSKGEVAGTFGLESQLWWIVR